MSNLVVKVGGAFLDDPALASMLFDTFAQLQASYNIVLVHGGGNAVQKLLSDLGQSTQKIDGLRVTPKEQIGYVTGVLAGTTNKSLCGLAINSKLNPIGLCLADGAMTTCEQLDPALGCVGKVTQTNANLLKTLLSSDYFPIVSSIGADKKGNLLNVNADNAATAVAAMLDAKLFFLSDVVGVLDDKKHVIAELDQQQIERLCAQNVIRDGMKVKVAAAQEAANSIGKPVTIASWLHPNDVFRLNDAPNPSLTGTQIFPDVKKQDFK